MFESMDTRVIMRQLVSIFLLSCSACTSAVENISSERTHILYKPENLPTNAPLVLALHGYGSNGRNLQWYSRMDEAADIQASLWPTLMEPQTVVVPDTGTQA